MINHGILIVPHRARKTTRKDYALYDYIVGMDEENMEDLRYIYGGDPEGKLSSLMSWAGLHTEVSDPWYTRDFDQALADIETGCRAMLRRLVTDSE